MRSVGKKTWLRAVRSLATVAMTIAFLMISAGSGLAAEGILKIFTQPDGAEIRIDGRFSGRTPMQPGTPLSLVVPAGRYEIDAVLNINESYERFARQQVMLGPDETLTLTLKLFQERLTPTGRRLAAARERRAAEITANAGRDGWLREQPNLIPDTVSIPAGVFTMGSPEGQALFTGSERPLHDVTLPAFEIGRFEVTFAEWDACIEAGGCRHRPDDYWGRNRQPVTGVSWHDAGEYLAWLSKITGQYWRLPTEAEWEYAARAGTDTPFWFGERIDPGVANYFSLERYKGSPTGEWRRKTVPVDTFAPSPFGLYNVHGNAGEWVADCWHRNYERAPQNGRAWVERNCEERVHRGGSFYQNPSDIRSAARRKHAPTFRDESLGFRVVRSLTALGSDPKPETTSDASKSGTQPPDTDRAAETPCQPHTQLSFVLSGV